jgi:pyruvate dehydrogenase (quinone)/pyruvate oxidase
MMAALPYSIGAQVAHPDRQVVAFTGDGSLTMMLGELVTLKQERLPVKVVVVKNGYLGLILWEQLVFLGNPQYGVDFADVDFAKVADACGIDGVSIDDPARCGEQLRAALAAEGPALIECVCDPYEPPNPPKITRDQALNLAEGLASGEPSRQRIALTIGRDLLDERTFAASPYGVTERLKDRVKDVLPGGGGSGGEHE